MSFSHQLPVPIISRISCVNSIDVNEFTSLAIYKISLHRIREKPASRLLSINQATTAVIIIIIRKKPGHRREKEIETKQSDGKLFFASLSPFQSFHIPASKADEAATTRLIASRGLDKQTRAARSECPRKESVQVPVYKSAKAENLFPEETSGFRGPLGYIPDTYIRKYPMNNWDIRCVLGMSA